MRTEFFTSIFATLSALLLAAALPVLADDADGKPDLYELSQNGKKLYLFGTFHLLPAELEWQKPVLVDKIAASSRFFMEQDLDAPDYEDAAFAALGRFLQRDSGQGDLAAELGNFYFERLVRLFGDDPGLRRQIAIQPPWYMSINVGLQAVNDAGLELGAGAEEWLAAEIAARGGDIEGLESADEALTAIASGSRAQQVAQLAATLQTLSEVEAAVGRLLVAWLSDDRDNFVRLFTEEYKDAPDLLAALLVNRNAAWMQKLLPVINSGDTPFVAVGAAHLYGTGGLLQRFQALGYSVIRH